MKGIQKEQFATYIKQYERLVFSVCFAFTRNYFDAEDLAQETFLSAYQNHDQFDGGNPKAYLTTIAANKCKDYLRRFERKNVPLEEQMQETIADTGGTPEDIILEADSSARVNGLCQQLNEPYQTVAIGYFVKDEKLSETAKRTGQNLRTLQTQLYRAKTQLKLLWEENKT